MEPQPTSPVETREALERTITYNYEALIKAREKYGVDGPNQSADLFEHRMNAALSDYGRLAVENVTT